MKRNFVFVIAIFALTAFTIGVVSITQQLNAQQTMPNKKKVDETAKEESKSSDEETEDQQKKIEKIRELIKKLQSNTNGDLEKLLKLRDTSSKGATTTIKDVTGRTITYSSDGSSENGNEGWTITVSPEEIPAFKQLGIPEWWMNPPEFANHIVFGRGVSCFEELDELQDAMNAAQLSARYEIGAKLGGRMNVKTNSENLEIQESGYLQTNNLREYKNEIVRTEEGYAYYVIYTYSLYNQALLRNDPTMIPKIKETLRMLEEHGAFECEKISFDKLKELAIHEIIEHEMTYVKEHPMMSCMRSLHLSDSGIVEIPLNVKDRLNEDEAKAKAKSIAINKISHSYHKLAFEIFTKYLIEINRNDLQKQIDDRFNPKKMHFPVENYQITNVEVIGRSDDVNVARVDININTKNIVSMLCEYADKHIEKLDRQNSEILIQIIKDKIWKR